MSNFEKPHQIPNSKAAQQVTPCYAKVKLLPDLWPFTLTLIQVLILTSTFQTFGYSEPLSSTRQHSLKLAVIFEQRCAYYGFGSNSINWNNYVASLTFDPLQDSGADQFIVEKQINQSPNFSDVTVHLTCKTWYANGVRGSAFAAGVSLKRIRSVPGNRVLPVRSSAIIHPTDQISTEKRSGTEIHDNNPDIWVKRSKVCVSINHLSCCNASSSTWSPAHGTSEWPRSPSSHHQCAVPNQSPKSGNNSRGWGDRTMKYSHFSVDEKRYALTFSSQSSFTARLPGFKSCRGENHKVD